MSAVELAIEWEREHWGAKLAEEEREHEATHEELETVRAQLERANELRKQAEVTCERRTKERDDARREAERWRGMGWGVEGDALKLPKYRFPWEAP